MKTLLSLSALALVVLAGAGCKNPVDAARERATQKVNEYAAEKLIESASGGKVDVDFNGGDDVTVKGEDGSSLSVGTDVKMPKNLSSDIPQYPGTKTSAVSFDTAGKNGGFTQTTPDALEDVYKALSSKLLAQGFTKTVDSRMDGVIISGFEKGNVKFTISISRGETDTETSIILTRSEMAQ